MIGRPAISPNGDAPLRSVDEVIAYLERLNEADRIMAPISLNGPRAALERIEKRNKQIAALRGQS